MPSFLLLIGDPWLAFQFDNAVNYLGITVENALYEKRNVGTEKKPDMQPMYTLEQLLDDNFRMPRPVKEQPKSGIAALMAMTGVRVHKAQS
jgi:hypothetical protein